jgi:sigma-E factor negative regulatory protein RseC
MKDPKGKNTISHKGIVQKSCNESVTVLITAESACSGCHAEGSCSISGKEEKYIVVKGSYEVNEGDTVTVAMEQSTGFTALFFGYVFPVLPVIISLIVFMSLGFPELVSGLLSIATLIPYYLILYLFRNKINDKFNFSIKV